MRFAKRYQGVLSSFILLLIPLLAAAGACSAIPIGGGTPGASASTSSSGGAGGMGGGGVEVCQPGNTVPCYTGPIGTEGVGSCASGTQTCNSDGTAYGPCVGEILPKAETCDAEMADEDCDGVANEEGPDCVCGDGYFSPGIGEECEDNNLDSNDPCDASCKLWACGDGMLQPWESCDDSNKMGGDACPATCVHSVNKVTTADDHNCVILVDDRIKCWGWNEVGQLGVGDTKNRGDDPDEMGYYLPAVDLGAGNVAVTIKSGPRHTCAILQDGRVKCWGGNWEGELGLGDRENRGDDPNEMGDSLPVVDLGTGKTAVAIAAGGQHTCAILNDGSVKCWGQNWDCQLGVGIVGSPRGDNPGEMGDDLEAVNLGAGLSAVAIAAGGGHTCAVLSDGSVKCWGANSYGQLGQGHTLPACGGPDPVPTVDLGAGVTATAIAGSPFSSCALLMDGRIKCWGSNELGQLGLGDLTDRGDNPGEMGDNLPAVDLGAGKTAIAIQYEYRHGCAILSDNSVKCWGRGGNGQLGLGDLTDRGDNPGEMGDNLPAVQLGTGKEVIAITTGLAHSCALFADHSLKCWGSNFYGALGTGYGALGTGEIHTLGDDPGEMGDALPVVDP